MTAQPIHLELAHLERRLVGLVGGPGGMPARHPDPGEKFAGAEGLADVVIGAGVERRDLVPLLASRRQDDDRDGGPLAQPTNHFEAVHVGQSQVDDDDIRLT